MSNSARRLRVHHARAVEPSSPARDDERPVKGTSKAPLAQSRAALCRRLRLCGADAEKAAVNTAVDSATDRIGIATGFARSTLMKHSEIARPTTISFDGKGDVDVESPGYPPERRRPMERK